MRKALYLLTGAAGFLGSNISRNLIAQGKSVRALVLPNDPAKAGIPSDVEVVTGDLLSNDSLEKFFNTPADTDIIVIHCASMVTLSPDYNQKVYEVNVQGTKNIIDKCVEYCAKKLVYVSSTSVIPELPKGHMIKEVESYNPHVVIGFYAKSKAEATQLVVDAVKRGLDASVVFPSGICGPNDYAYGYITNLIIDYIAGKIPAGIDGSFNTVDVRDLADGIIACAEKGRSGEGYIMSNSKVSMHDLYKSISKASGSREVKLIIPVPIAKVIAAQSTVVSKLNRKPSLLTSFGIYNLVRNNDFSSEKAKRELGYRVRSFDETIKDTVLWLKKEGKLPAKCPSRNPTSYGA